MLQISLANDLRVINGKSVNAVVISETLTTAYLRFLIILRL